MLNYHGNVLLIGMYSIKVKRSERVVHRQFLVIRKTSIRKKRKQLRAITYEDGSREQKASVNIRHAWQHKTA